MKIKLQSTTLLVIAILITFSLVACNKSTSLPTGPADGMPITYSTNNYVDSGLINPEKACYGYTGADVIASSPNDIVVVWADVNSEPNNEDGYEVSWMSDVSGEITKYVYDSDPNVTMAILSTAEFPPQNVTIEAYQNGDGNSLTIRASEGLELSPCEDGVIELAFGVFPTSPQNDDGTYLLEDKTQAPFLENDITSLCVAPYPMENYPDAVIVKWEDTNSAPNESFFKVSYGLKLDCNSIENDEARKASCFAEIEKDDEFGYRAYDSKFWGKSVSDIKVQKDFTELIIPEGWKMVGSLYITPMTSELLNGFTKNWGSGAEGTNPKVSTCPPDTTFDGVLQNDDGNYDYDDMPQTQPYSVVGLCKFEAYDYGIQGISDPTTLNWGDTNHYPLNESGFKVTLRDANGREFLLDTGDNTPIDYSAGGIEAFLDSDLSSSVVSRASGFTTISIQPYFKSLAETSPNGESVFVYGDEATFDIQTAPNCID